MNKVILCGRLTKDVELTYSQKNTDMAIGRYAIAVDSGYGEKKRTDFLNCVAFGKAGEFASKYFHKGQRVLVEGRIQIDKGKDEKYYTNIIVESQEFADGNKTENKASESDEFVPIADGAEDELPFN